MSFILDALRKSEHERQSQGSAEFVAQPSVSSRKSTPRWLWLIGLLLAVNLAVLAGLFLRPDVSSGDGAVQPQPSSTPSFAERAAAARANAPPRQVPSSSVAQSPAEESAATDTRVVPDVITQDATAIDTSAVYPTLQEVVASGSVALPPLHLDIHVFSETPADRFVFINMTKHREGSQLDEGPRVQEIRPEGVVLIYRGTEFLLTRE